MAFGRRRAMFGAMVLAFGVGCPRQSDDASDAPASSTPIPVPGAASEQSTASTPALGGVPAERRCGEVGTEPTPPPPGLLSSVELVGQERLSPGDTRRIGNVDVEYDPDLDFGTMEIVDRRPGISAIIDRSVEPIDGAWGSRSMIPTQEPLRFGVGPYRIELHPVADADASATTKPDASPGADPGVEGEPSPPVEVRLLRKGCPNAELADWPTGDFASMWLGNATMVLHHLPGATGWIQPEIQEQAAGGALRLRWHYSSVHGTYGDTVELTPESKGRRFFGLGVEARIAQIEPAPGVTFDEGRWSSTDGTPLVAVRVDVVRRPPATPTPRPSAVSSGCGEPSRSELPWPKDAAALPRRAGRVKVGVGSPATLDGLSLSLTHTEYEPRPYSDEPPEHMWSLMVGDGHGRTLDSESFSSTAMVMAGPKTPRSRLRVDDSVLISEPVTSAGFDPVRVRRWALGCPESWEGPMASEPEAFWMGTLGLQTVSFKSAPLHYLMHAQLRSTGETVGLSITAHGDVSYHASTLTPDAVGQRFWIHDREVEIVAVEAGEGTRWDGAGWQTTHVTGPNVLVYLRLRPSS